MTTPATIRAAVADLVENAIPPARAAVHRYPPGGVTQFPAVIVGQAAWEPGVNGCLNLWTVSVSVVVAQPGLDDEATIAQLEDVWPDVYTTLDEAIDADQSLGGVCAVAQLTRARPGLLEIAGVRYPATAIEIQLHG